MSTTDPESARRLVAAAVLGPGLHRATFGGAVRGGAPSPWVRVVVRAVELRGEPHLQFEQFDARKAFTRNVPVTDAGPPLDELLRVGFAGVHVSTDTEEIDVRTTKKGK